MIDLPEALIDDELFGRWFSGPTWAVWRSVIKGAWGRKLDDEELALFRQVAQRDPPKKRVRELWAKVGRRGGKDSIASAVGAHRAGFPNYAPFLRPGETANVTSIAVDRLQARIALRYARAYFEEVALLRPLLANETSDGFNLSTRVEFSVLTNNFRAVRGRPFACVILSECAFYRSEESANPDSEVYNAVTPGLATIKDSLIVGISSPYRRSGLLFEKWRDHFGKPDDDVLVVEGASRLFNSSLPQHIVDQAMEKDPASARAEWLGEWRDDIAAYLPREVVEAAVDRGVVVRPPLPNVRYVGFCDAASGTGGDSFSIGIAHLEGEVALVDVAHEVRPPFNPQSVIADVSKIFASYGIRQVTGDRWAPGFVADAFNTNQIKYTYSERDRSQIYLEALPPLVSGRVRLPDNTRLVAQLAALERRTSSSGRDRIGHPTGSASHDDLANAACGAIVEALSKKNRPMVISAEVLARASVPGWGFQQSNARPRAF